jgi:hypothetical protein
MALRYHPRCALIDAMHHVDAEARRWQRQWVEWSEAGRIPDHRPKINNHGSWKLERICTMIALTYDCYYTTDMTLAGAGKRAHLAPGDRYRPGYGQTLICLINLRKHGRTFQGPSHAGPCVVNVADEKQARVSDVASYAASESQLAAEGWLFHHPKQAYRASKSSF